MFTGDKAVTLPDADISRLISLAEAAAYARLDAEYLRQLAASGRLQATKVGRNWVTTERAVDAYLAGRLPRGRKPRDG